MPIYLKVECMELNVRYQKIGKEIDEYFKNKPCIIKNKISYEETCNEIDEFLGLK